MNKSPTITSALPKRGGRKPPLSEALIENAHNDPQPSPGYTNYFSPFDLYPLLRSHSISDFSPSLFIHPSHVTDNSHSSTTRLASSGPSIGPSLDPDLKPLRLAVLSKRLDPSKRLCQYESGGGTCRDDKCEDLHLSRLGGLLEPTGAWCVQCNALELTYFGIHIFSLTFDILLIFPSSSLRQRDCRLSVFCFASQLAVRLSGPFSR
jgi:hypothetical protein